MLEIPTLYVMNKIDLLEDFTPRIDRNEDNLPVRVWVSAQTGEGILLYQALTERLSGEIAHVELRLPPEEAGRLRSRFINYRLLSVNGLKKTVKLG